MNKIKIFNFADPYRFFFPLGIIGSILGTGIWVFVWVVQKKWITGFNTDTYPVEVHVGLIGGLFLLPVIKGFILTAIPRFTGTSLTGPVEIIPFQILQIMIAGLLLFFPNENIVHYFLTFDILLLMLFVLSRFYKSPGKISPYLKILGTGLLLGTAGFALQIEFFSIDLDLKSQLSRSLIFYGMIPCIITGAGAKIINVIVNTDSPQSRMQWMQKAESSSSSFLISIIFALSFVLEIILIKNIYSDYSSIFRIIRFSIIVFWLVNFFHILDISAFTSKLSKLILISSYLLIFGYAGHTFKTAYSIHLAHIYFIGGISLVILCIMTRVALSHGQADIVIEKKSAIFYWILGFIVVATATRATAIFVTNQYFSHLAYSSIFFIIAMLVWGIFILRQLNSGSQD